MGMMVIGVTGMMMTPASPDYWYDGDRCDRHDDDPCIPWLWVWRWQVWWMWWWRVSGMMMTAVMSVTVTKCVHVQVKAALEESAGVRCHEKLSESMMLMDCETSGSCAGERVGYEEPFCGRFSAKNPGILYRGPDNVMDRHRLSNFYRFVRATSQVWRCWKVHPFKFFAFSMDVFKNKTKTQKSIVCLSFFSSVSLSLFHSLSLSRSLSVCLSLSVSKCVVFKKSWYAFAMFKECVYDMPTFC